ncbi:MAG: 30S ribosomal protein S17 [Candidatus Sumerlaeia bacterium]
MDGKTTDRGNVKERTGKVLSARMDKTIVVAVDRLVQHPLYGKTVRRTKKLYAHDEQNRCHEGDVVKVIETRPMSKLKRWRVSAILERAK